MVAVSWNELLLFAGIVVWMFTVGHELDKIKARMRKAEERPTVGLTNEQLEIAVAEWVRGR